MKYLIMVMSLLGLLLRTFGGIVEPVVAEAGYNQMVVTARVATYRLRRYDDGRTYLYHLLSIPTDGSVGTSYTADGDGTPKYVRVGGTRFLVKITEDGVNFEAVDVASSGGPHTLLESFPCEKCEETWDTICMSVTEILCPYKSQAPTEALSKALDTLCGEMVSSGLCSDFSSAVLCQSQCIISEG